MSIALANDLIFKEINTIDFFDVASGDFLFTLDELSSFSMEHGEEKVDVMGRNGRILSRIKRNKSVRISGTNGIISAGLLSLQTGGEYVDGNVAVMWVDNLTISDNKATTKCVAAGTLDAEIISLLVNMDDGSTVELEQAPNVASGKFTYSPATKILSFNNGDYADGTRIVVRYMRQIYATRLNNDADKYSGVASIYVNGFAEDKCSNQYRVQFFFPKVDFSGEFTIEFGETQSIHNFEAVATSGACGAMNTYYTYTIFDGSDPIFIYVGTDNRVYIGNDNGIYTSYRQGVG